MGRSDPAHLQKFQGSNIEMTRMKDKIRCWGGGHGMKQQPLWFGTAFSLALFLNPLDVQFQRVESSSSPFSDLGSDVSLSITGSINDPPMLWDTVILHIQIITATEEEIPLARSLSIVMVPSSNHDG